MEIGRPGGGGGGRGGEGGGGGRGVMALGAANSARLEASPSSSSSSSSLKTNGEKGFLSRPLWSPIVFPFSFNIRFGFSVAANVATIAFLRGWNRSFFSNFIERRETNVLNKGWRRLRRSGLLRLVPG